MKIIKEDITQYHERIEKITMAEYDDITYIRTGAELVEGVSYYYYWMLSETTIEDELEYLLEEKYNLEKKRIKLKKKLKRIIKNV